MAPFRCPRFDTVNARAARIASIVMLAFAGGLPARTAAQVGEEIPSANYYLAVSAVYSGDYRSAERELLRESQRGVRAALQRWVDSICYHAMLGEVYYHQGRNAEALTQFTEACKYIIEYPDWLTRVQFQAGAAGVRPDTSLARRVPPWGQSSRQFVLGQFPRTEQTMFGQPVTRETIQQSGVIAPPQLWRVNVAEIVRASALAIRRRGEMLGPLAPHDPVFKEISNKLAGGNLSPPGHWSSIWIDLQRGMVHSAMGQFDQAATALSRATVAGGQFDHPLTCVALFEQGRIALLSGNGPAAAQLLAEAGFSAYYYENWDVLTESSWLGWVNHIANGGSGVYPPLPPISQWAQSLQLHHIATKLRLGQAETLLWMGELPAAGALLDDAGRRLVQIRTSAAGVFHAYLQSALLYLKGQNGPASVAVEKALAGQSAVSLRNFQIGLTSRLFDENSITARVAADAYKLLLADPSPLDWAYQPLDSMAVLKTAHEAAFDRWFLALAGTNNVVGALDVAEQAKRRRYLTSLPLGGRLVALRAILEAPERELSRDAVFQRQNLLATFPAYRELSTEAALIRDQLRAGPVIAKDQEAAKPLADRYDAWLHNAKLREEILMQMALRRLPSSLEFPPSRPTAELQKTMRDGTALVAFHSAGNDLYGFLLTRSDVQMWKLGDVRRIRTQVGDFLRALGNVGSGRTFTPAELARDQWRSLAAELYTTLLGDSRLDLSKTKELAIVPDDALWYLPFDALQPPGDGPAPLLSDRAPIRFAPTVAIALSASRPFRRPLHTGIVASQSSADEEVTGGEDLLVELEKLVTGPLSLSAPLPEPGYAIAPLLDELIVLDDVGADRAPAGNWSPFPRPQRNAPSDTLDAWFPLPDGGPSRVIITSFTTEAEQGMRGGRRAAGVAPGDEVFQSVCAFLANGAQTILLTRWRTGGRTNFDLVREFVQEVPHMPAADAWQRGVTLARETPLDPGREPRIKRTENDANVPTASHPFFWAGYLLVDTGTRPGSEDDVGAEAPGGARVPATAAPIAPPAMPPLPPPQSPGMPPRSAGTPTHSDGTPQSSGTSPPGNNLPSRDSSKGGDK